MHFIKSRLPLLIVITIFVLLKLPHLPYAYYWDESIPYAVAIKELYHHGISLMPNAIDPELSRGHPLFFHAIAAIWMHIFGDSHVAMHSFALLISVVLLIAIYEAGLQLFNQRVAIFALLSIATFEMFFVQSAMVLFEVLVALLCFLSLIFYVRNKYFLTGLCLTMLFYTKESGMVMGFVLGTDALICLFQKETKWRIHLYHLLSVGVPCILIGIYFLVQKQVQGWYIFPFYADLVPHSWDSFWYAFRINSIRAQFYNNYRYLYFLLLVAVAIIAAIKQKKAAFLSVLLPLTCIYYFVDDKRAGRLLPGVPFFIVFVASACFFLYHYARQFAESSQRKLIILAGLFILCFLCFSAMNFFTPRYLLASIVPMFFISAAFFDMFIGLTYAWLQYPIIAGIIGFSTLAFDTNDSFGDNDMGTFDALDVQQGVVNYFEKNVPYNANIGAGPFLELKHLSIPATGFLHSEKAFNNLQYGLSYDTEYILFDNIEPDTNYERFKNNKDFHRVYRIEKGKVWAEVYRRK